ncbi:hypothetical protein ACS0TY_027720 [Phlomoides rotata]
MEKDWPPLKECPQYKYGMINHYIEKQEWEDNLTDETAYYYTSGSDEEDEENLHKYSYVRSSLKTFLDQARYTRGYGVDIWAPAFMGSPFMPVDSKYLDREWHQTSLSIAAELAINHINSKTKKVYKYVKTVKLVDTTNRVLLLTFTAKEDAPDAEEQTFLAATSEMPTKEECELLECFLKPEGPAPTNLD